MHNFHIISGWNGSARISRAQRITSIIVGGWWIRVALYIFGEQFKIMNKQTQLGEEQKELSNRQIKLSDKQMDLSAVQLEMTKIMFEIERIEGKRTGALEECQKLSNIGDIKNAKSFLEMSQKCEVKLAELKKDAEDADKLYRTILNKKI